MKKYRPKSWSTQARELADRFLEWENQEAAKESLFNSYRHPLIKHRAIKRFGRLKNI